MKIWISRIAIILLSLSAAFGVYEFARMFVTDIVAVITAGGFELTYIGLAVLDNLTPEQKIRANRLSLMAVFVSMIFNSIAGFVTRNPNIAKLDTSNIVTEVILTVIHGVPLALLAYLVSNLVLHKEGVSINESETESFHKLSARVESLHESLKVAQSKNENFQIEIESLKIANETFMVVAESLQSENENLKVLSESLKVEIESFHVASRYSESPRDNIRLLASTETPLQG